MNIKYLNVSKPFKYLWLKSVIDVNLDYHCAKCLIGAYNSNINANITQLKNLEIENEVHYLCGVSIPYRWSNNFHLAFQYCEGHTLEYSNNGIHIIIENAVELPISYEYINPSNINAMKKNYYTCRNWQFAHYFKKYLQ